MAHSCDAQSQASALRVCLRHTFGERQSPTAGNPPAVLAHRAGVPRVEATGVAKRPVRDTLSEKILKKILN
jgi:hypothetical protein